ncbi:MAG: PASTA domain-containing protein [Terracidiphilus sp.]|jgi:beta-lactam-binding protein with PASTA domain
MFQGVGFPAFRILLVSALILGAAIVPQAQSQALLTRHVRDVTLNGQAPLVGRVPATQSMRLVLVLPHRNEAELIAFLKDLYDPSSPSYRKFLTVEEFTARFGPSQEDYDAVTRFAEANGLTVVGTSRNRMNLDVSGPAANVEAAFHLTMGTYQHPTENRTFFAPDREPTPNLAVQLWHIGGLDDYSTPKPALVRRDAGTALPALVRSDAIAAEAQPDAKVQPYATTGTGPSASYLGSDMRAAYYVNGNAANNLTGTGQSVGVLEFAGVDLADLTTYYTNAGQTNNVPITLKSVDTQSTTCTFAGPPACDDTEQTLDMTQVLGMAPGLSSLVVYIGTGALTGQTIDDSAILNAMATASPLNAQLSASWDWTPADPTTDDPYFEEFAAQGQNFFADASDDGIWRSGVGYYWPAESVYVTTVGGTVLTTTGAGGQWASETGWADGGGGISPDDYAIPSWQVATAAGCAACSQTYRNGPDVSANADFSFYVCADQYTPCSANLYGGPSFATPMWAGYMALVNEQALLNGHPVLGFINPALYTIGLGADYGTDFHDITSGGNTLGTTVGYDLSTGWGSPNGSALINALAGSAIPNFTISASPTPVSVAQGASGTSTITTTVSGGFNSSIALSATGQPTGVTATFSPNPIAAPGSGTSILTLTVALTTATGMYPITVTGTGGTLTPTTQVNLTVTGAAQVAVPNVVGETQAAAETAIATAGLVVGTVTTASSPTVASGDVISESPGAGTSVNTGSAVNLVVSTGAAQVVVPNVVGDTQAVASTAIAAAGLVVGTITTANSSNVPSGDVISENPSAGTSVNTGSAVNLLISTGPAQVVVPNVVGETQAAATTAIDGAGLVVGTVTMASSPTVASGNVISESPSAGTTVNSSSAVNLVVSTGPAPVTVPNVVGDTQAAATSAIIAAGLAVGTVSTASSPSVASGNVISENPSAGTSAGPGSAVNLVVSTGPAPAPSYTLSANPSSLTIKSGSSASTVITLTPTGGFTGTVNFTCGTLPSDVTCLFAPASLTVTSSTALTTTLTIGTTGTAMASLGNRPAGPVLPPLLVALILLPLGFMRRVLRTRKAGSQWLGLLLLAGTCLAAAGLLGTAGCGGNSSSTPAGTYSIPITVTSGSTTVPLNLSITIQ